MAAIKHGLPIVMKTGRLAGRRFEADVGMTHALQNIVDVAQAEAAVADDRDRILTMVRDEWGGFDALNAKVVSAINASRSCADAPEVQAAACGDEGALDVAHAGPEKLADWAYAAAGGGFAWLLERRLLPAGARVDVITAGGMNAVMAAAQNGQLAALRVALDAPGGEAAVGMRAGNGATALHMAASSGSTETARLLLDRRADPHVRDNDGQTPLVRAAKASGDAGLEVARLLLEAGADVNSQEESGAAPLHFACMFSNVKVAELLLEHGADQRLRGTFGEAKAHAARAVRKAEVLALLARY